MMLPRVETGRELMARYFACDVFRHEGTRAAGTSLDVWWDSLPAETPPWEFLGRRASRRAAWAWVVASLLSQVHSSADFERIRAGSRRLPLAPAWRQARPFVLALIGWIDTNEIR